MISTDVERLAVELLGLPSKSRAELAKRLIDSLDEDEPPELDDAAMETIQRRAREMAEGKVQGIPAEEAMRRARQRLR
jgi:putative addiction module component (TIGR02574 family)